MYQIPMIFYEPINAIGQISSYLFHPFSMGFCVRRRRIHYRFTVVCQAGLRSNRVLGCQILNGA
jgi:hypothetical protein